MIDSILVTLDDVVHLLFPRARDALIDFLDKRVLMNLCLQSNSDSAVASVINSDDDDNLILVLVNSDYVTVSLGSNLIAISLELVLSVVERTLYLFLLYFADEIAILVIDFIDIFFVGWHHIDFVEHISNDAEVAVGVCRIKVVAVNSHRHVDRET